MEKISKEMKISDIVKKIPQSADVMAGFGLHCIGCAISAYESLEQGALAHGLDPEMIEEMVKEINELENKADLSD